MQNNSSFGQEKIGKLLLQYSAPAIAGFLVFGFNRMAGNVFIGQVLGATALAGFTIANSVSMVILACSTLVGTGAAAVISMRLGTKKVDEARQVLGTALVLAMVLGAMISVIGWLCLNPMLRIFGADGAVLVQASHFTAVFLIGSSFQILTTVLNGAMRAEGKPLKAFLTNILSFLISTALTGFFLLIVPLGISGAALANVLSSLIMTIWLGAHFRGKSTILRLERKNLHWNPDIVRSTLKIGVAPGSLQGIAAFLSILTNHLAMANGGENSVAVMGVVFTIYFLLIMPLQGTSVGIQPIIGFNHGAGLHDRVRQCVTAALVFTTAICVFEFLIVMTFRGTIPLFFLATQPELAVMSSQGLLLVLLAFPIAGVQFVGSSYFQSTGKASQALFINLFRSLFIILPLLILPRFLGMNGLFLSYSLTEILMAVIGGSLIWLELHRKKQSKMAFEASK